MGMGMGMARLSSHSLDELAATRTTRSTYRDGVRHSRYIPLRIVTTDIEMFQHRVPHRTVVRQTATNHTRGHVLFLLLNLHTQIPDLEYSGLREAASASASARP